MKSSPILRTHTHWQVAQSSHTSQNLPKNMAAHLHGRKESTGIQHCIRAIADEVVKSRSVHLINFCGGGQIIALKSATALILDRWPRYLPAVGILANGAETMSHIERRYLPSSRYHRPT